MNTVERSTDTAVSVEEFKAVFRNYPGGVAVITADSGQGPVALTATSVASVSVAPPMLVFSISELSSSTPTIRKAETVVIHLIRADELSVAQLGATSGVDRFADHSIWERLPSGEPYFTAIQTWIRARVVRTMDVGGSAVVAVVALETRMSDEHGDPLVYHNRTWHRLGAHSKIPEV